MDEPKRILVADDQPHVRRLLHDILGDIYDVSCVSNGRQLYHLLTSCREEFDLVIVDIIMPDWTGKEGVEAARGLGSEVPVLYMTGYEPEKNGFEYILKPFSGSDLISRVQKILYKDQIEKAIRERQ